MRGIRNLLEAALEIVFPPRDTERIVRALRYSALKERRCPRITIIRRTAIITLLRYRTPTATALVLEAKFHANRRAHMLLGKLLALYIKEYAKVSAAAHIAPRCIVLVPIPLGRRRREERGYNQAEEVCRCSMQYFSDSAGDAPFQVRVLLMPDLLLRPYDTPPQTSLARTGRLRNMEGAFVAAAVPDRSYLYMVVDDVLTTGATIRAAVQALKEAGATRIMPLALAH